MYITVFPTYKSNLVNFYVVGARIWFRLSKVYAYVFKLYVRSTCFFFFTIYDETEFLRERLGTH